MSIRRARSSSEWELGRRAKSELGGAREFRVGSSCSSKSGVRACVRACIGACAKFEVSRTSIRASSRVSSPKWLLLGVHQV